MRGARSAAPRVERRSSVTPAPDPSAPNDIELLALQKMERVLGAERARHLLARMVAEHQLVLREPNDLLKLAAALRALGGIEAAVGAMVGVAAVLRGAHDPAA